eukprot:10894433-Lingulodinium_polyedra.AAC.1
MNARRRAYMYARDTRRVAGGAWGMQRGTRYSMRRARYAISDIVVDIGIVIQARGRSFQSVVGRS